MDKKSILSIIIVVVLCVSAAYNYIYQDHRDVKTETADFSISTVAIIDEFSNNPTETESKYLNKIIKVSGTISEVNDTNIILDDFAFCSFLAPITSSLEIGTKIKVKGRVIGYDDLFEQVKLDQCSIID